jgi:hypothetical protein
LYLPINVAVGSPEGSTVKIAQSKPAGFVSMMMATQMGMFHALDWGRHAVRNCRQWPQKRWPGDKPNCNSHTPSGPGGSGYTKYGCCCAYCSTKSGECFREGRPASDCNLHRTNCEQACTTNYY